MTRFNSAIDAVVKLIETLGSLSTGTSPLLRPAKEAKLSADFTQDPALQTRIDTAGKYLRLRTGLEGLRLAVVDLTNSAKPPVYTGFHDQEEVTVFSVAKLLMMYAAFQLRHDVSELAARSRATTQDDLIKEAKDQWATAPAQRVKNILASDQSFPKAGPPDLKRIFTMVHGGDGWKVDFTRSNKTLAELEGLDVQMEPLDVPKSLALIDQLGFLDRMKLAIGWSTDVAAATCVRDVGYPYMAALALQSGLYDYDEQADKGPGGLWLGGDYTEGAVAGPWRHSPVGNFRPAGTARALATFMTLLARDRLVDPKASADMRDLMEFLKTVAELHKQLPAGQTTTNFTRSFLAEGLRDHVTLKAVYRKIGIVNHIEHEAALIEVDEALPRRYVLVALGAVHSAEDHKKRKALLAEVAAEIDSCLENWHATRPGP
jgi:hypothetical protein